jgi:hypothetical protein
MKPRRERKEQTMHSRQLEPFHGAHATEPSWEIADTRASAKADWNWFACNTKLTKRWRNSTTAEQMVIIDDAGHTARNPKIATVTIERVGSQTFIRNFFNDTGALVNQSLETSEYAVVAGAPERACFRFETLVVDYHDKCKIDRDYFKAHPDVKEYERDAFPEELEQTQRDLKLSFQPPSGKPRVSNHPARHMRFNTVVSIDVPGIPIMVLDPEDKQGNGLL